MKKNLLYSFIYEVVIAFYPIILIPYLSVTIGKSGVGIYSYTYSIVAIFLLFCQLGVNTCGTRAIAQNRDSAEVRTKIFMGIFSIQFFAGAICLLVYSFFFILLKSEYNIYFLLLLPFLLGQSIRTSWFFLGIEKLQVILFRNVFIRVISALMIFLCVKEQEDLNLYFIIMSGSYFIGDISVFPQLKKYLIKTSYDVGYLFKYVKPMFYMFIPVIALRGSYYLDEIMIGALDGTDSVAFYENAYKIVNMPLQLYTVLANVLTAQASYLIAQNKKNENLQNMIYSIDLSSSIIIPIIAGLIAISDTLIPWYMGQEFYGTIYVMKVLPIIIIFSGINNILRTQYFIPTNQDRKYIVSILGGVLINILLNCIFIMRWSYIGAAVASVISEVIITFISVILVNKEVSIRKAFTSMYIYIISSAIMAIVVYFLGTILESNIYSTFIQIIAGIIIYFLISYTMIVLLNKEEVNIYSVVKKMLQHKCLDI